MRNRSGVQRGVSIEQVEPRYLMAVFAPDPGYHPLAKATIANRYFTAPVSKGRLLIGGAEAIGSGEDLNYIGVITRLLPDGSTDKTFGTNGRIALSYDFPSYFTGTRIYVDQPFEKGARVLAYTVNGKPDPTYGGGDGIAELTVKDPGLGSTIADSQVVKIYDDGSVLTDNEFLVSSGGSFIYRDQLIRLTGNGTFDTSFGLNGRLTVNSISSMKAYQTGNSLYAYIDKETSPGQVIKYDKDGKAKDTSFGTNGTLTVPAFASQFTEQPDGKLVFLAGKTDTTLFRVNADGSPDTGFGSNGQIPLQDLTSSSGGVGGGILLDDQGRITVAVNDTIFRFDSTGKLDAFPYNGTAVVIANTISYDDQGRLISNSPNGARYILVASAQLGSDGVVHVVGDNGKDTVTVSAASGNKLRVVVNGETDDFNVSDVTGIRMDLYGGDDTVNVSVDLPATIMAAQGDDSIVTAGGDDQIDAGNGSDTVKSGDGNDTIDFGSPNLNTTNDVHRVDDAGVSGNKTIGVGSGSSIINLGIGSHFITTGSGSINHQINIAGGQTTAILSGKVITLNIGGSAGNTITASEFATGNVSITTGSGNDTMFIDAANCVVHAGAGDDRIVMGTRSSTGGPTIYGDAGNDLITSTDSFDALATVYGGDGNDKIVGGSLAQALYGEGGKDTLQGGDGDDYISGGGANDRINGDAGNDLVFGGTGDDLIDGGSGNDNLSAQDGRDHIYGRDGDDRLYGGAAGDSLYTNNGNDRVYGQGGDDRIFADYAQGKDTLYGGAGNDQFVTKDGLMDLVFGDGGQDSATVDNKDVLTSVEL